MESKAIIARRDLEQLLVDETAEPKPLPLSLLEDITGDFSDDQEIGRGGFAVVYKGILGDRVVAVKKLYDDLMDENKFHREVECLMRVKHKNVVRFLGYCADRQGNMARYEGKLVMADVHQRLLCFEYIPKGSLDKYIIDPHREWGMCYKIIKGICEGLHNLHDNCIVHLDLKPANIMLDDNMSPKITDFGLSRCFNDNQTREITKNISGTLGYMAPEFNEKGVIARSADLYSLGVIIIEILTGQKGYQATEDVLESWRDRIERSQQETHCEQIRVCYEIALECRDFNPMKRPASALNIIDRLHQTEGFLIGMALGRDVQIRMAGQLNEQSSREALPSLLIQVPSRTIPGFDCVGSDTSTCSLSLHETNKETVITIPAPATPPPADPVPAYDDTQIPYSLSLRAASVHRDEARVAAVETTPAGQAEARSPRLLKQTLFHSQPILHASQQLNEAPRRQADSTRDKRFDPFKTFSGRLERQLANLRRGHPIVAIDLDSPESKISEETDQVPGTTDRYFDALEGIRAWLIEEPATKNSQWSSGSMELTIWGRRYDIGIWNNVVVGRDAI